MKDEIWFKHDKNARRDPKIQALRAKLGPEGYGIYFMLIEVMAEQAGYRLEKFPLMVAGLSIELGVKEELLEKVLGFIITECELFRQDDTHIWSESLLRRMSAYDETRKKRADSGRIGGFARHSSSKPLANAKQMLSKPLAVPQQIIAEESRVDKSREERGGGDPPTVLEVREYAEAEHLKADPQQFHDYQTAKGLWKTMVDWKAAFRYWNRNEHHDKAPVEQAIGAPSKVWVDTVGANTRWSNSFHDKHTAGDRCSFCGKTVKAPAICDCPGYSAGFSKHMESAV